MSWDVLVVRVADAEATAAALAPEAVLTLGTLADVRTTLQQTFPRMTFPEPGMGLLEGNGYAARFSLGDEEPVRGLLILITGDEAMGRQVVHMLAAATGWRAFDTNTEAFLSF